MIICIPELNNKIIQSVISNFPDLDFIGVDDLKSACNLVKSKKADTLLSGLDFSSRDVLIACRDNLPLKSRFFSSSFFCEKGNTHYLLADGGVNKLPSKEQLLTIVEDSAENFLTYYNEQPKIALLSYSTMGSGGKNPDLKKYAFVLENIRKSHPDWLIEGEMQLDAAINPRVAAKKIPNSKLAGSANILITPDLNSGNLLYKAMEQFAGYTIAGPIIQGFEVPLADLSRGSTAADVILTIRVISKLCEKSKNFAQSSPSTTLQTSQNPERNPS